MHPVLLEAGGFVVHTYGFMIAVGFLVAVWNIRRLADRAGLDSDRVLDLTFWSLLVGFAGARLLFVITRWGTFASDPLAVLRVWEGGLVFFGGPLAVLPFVIWYVRRHGMALWKVMDTLIPGLTIAHAFGRIGCIGAGCCHGRPTGADWGFRFESELVDASLRGLPLHPTQLYEAVALTVLFFGLLTVTRRKAFDGQVVLTYFMAYPVIRSLIEIFRGDQIRGFVIEGVLSTSQFISLGVFVAATLALGYRLRQLGGARKEATV